MYIILSKTVSRYSDVAQPIYGVRVSLHIRGSSHRAHRRWTRRPSAIAVQLAADLVAAHGVWYMAKAGRHPIRRCNAVDRM